MKSSIEVLGRVSQVIKNLSSAVALKVLSLLNQPDCLDVTIEFVSANEIRRLNCHNRNIDKVTDVLSFPSTNTVAGERVDLTCPENLACVTENGNIHLGDIAICMQRARQQAKEYGNTPVEEVKKLVIHSILHLLGFDHISDSDYEVMHKKEEELFLKIKV